MENQLKQRILINRLSDLSLAESIDYHQEGEKKDTHSPQLAKVKRIALVGIVAAFIAYRIGFATGPISCLVDLSHQWTTWLNNLVNKSPLFYNAISIISQQMLDFSIVLMSIIALIRMQNLRLHLFAASFYGIRALFLNIEKLPYPAGMISYTPVLSCLTVPYGITRDFYYSGHTGIILFSILFWRRLKYKKMERWSYLFLFVVVFVLLVTRVHYIIDVIGGAIFALWIEKYFLARVAWFDYIFSCIYHGLIFLYTYVKIALS